MTIEQAVAAGDVVRTQWPAKDAKHLNLYLGSGRFGGCFDAAGFMGVAEAGERGNATVLQHADHFGRGEFEVDNFAPVGRLVWDDLESLGEPSEYRQHLDLHNGRLWTSMTFDACSLSVTTFFHPQRRDLLSFDINYRSERPLSFTLLAQGEREWIEGQLRSVLRTNVATTEIVLAVDRGISSGTGLRPVSASQQAGHGPEPRATGDIMLPAGEGRVRIILGVAAETSDIDLSAEIDATLSMSPDDWQADAQRAWRDRWGEQFIAIDEPNLQALWARSMFWILSTYGPDARSPAPPMGWTGFSWQRHFPQDVSYIAPVLLRMGHADIVKAWCEFYFAEIESMRRLTQRLWNVPGTFWAWEFPIGHDSDQQLDGEKMLPNIYQFELHNAAYPARMAFETSLELKDESWSREIAWPIIEGSATFYAALLTRTANGTWELNVTPSSGQDEMAGENAPNYFDALLAAMYCLRIGAEMSASLSIENDDIATWRSRLADGLAFEKLYDASEQMFAGSETVPLREALGRQKHPVQLHPLLFLPQTDERVNAAAREAYRRRAELCKGVEDEPEGSYWGWTLPTYWLAAARCGDGDGLRQELSRGVPSGTIDREWLQIYESGGYRGPYYTTSSGLFCQAMQEAADRGLL